MKDTAAELEKLKAVCPKAEIWPEGGRSLVHLPDLKFFSNGQTRQQDALLYPYERDGYPTRLFLSAPVPGKGQNWNAHNICGKTWHACSWKDVSANLSWVEILLGHLRVLA